MPTLTIFLLTHNRTEQALAAIESILSQTSDDYQLVVSDNSDTNELQQHLDQYKDKLVYLKRPLVLEALKHFNQCLSEVNTEYFCLFHDDDLMLSTYVSNFLNAKERHRDAVAFGCNAYLENSGVRTGVSFKSKQHYVGPILFNSLIAKYFSKNQSGIAPFPSYIYKRCVAQSLSFAVDAGKYGDVRFLIQIATFGKMIWINLPMMIYKIHESNDSGNESRRDRLRFLRFLRNLSDLDEELLSDYRYFLYKKILAGSGGHLKPAHNSYFRVLEKYIVAYKCARYFRYTFYANFTKKIFF